MNAQELADLISVRGYDVRVRGDEVVFRTCTSCGNPNANLEASSSKNVYHCWSCGASGRLADLLSDIGADAPEDLEVRWEGGDEDRPRPTSLPPDTISLDTQPSATAYLRRRGVEEAAASWLGIRVQREGPRLVFPLREFWYGYPVGYVSRGYGPATGPRYLSNVTCPRSLPGWRGSDDGIVVVVEGVFDALAVRRAGFGAAMLLGTGRERYAMRWGSQAAETTRLVVMLDAAAEREARALGSMLRGVHGYVSVAQLPEGDPASTPTEELRNYITETER